jgi:signal transduction histidine kinase
MQVKLPGGGPLWLSAGFIFTVALFFGLLVILLTLLRTLRGRHGQEEEPPPARPSQAGETAFASASVQAVIQKLREQERELERLHRVERERAQQTERLSLAVTRNMPTGLLLVGANGLVSLANPAAETGLGCGALQYRRYTDVLGVDTPIARLLTECLREGRTFQREQVEHFTSAGELRQLGVTISPTAQGQDKVTGALCLLSDLTELTALQRQIRLKESLASLGEMSAGIAHEFKNSLATVSAYAQLIQQEAGGGESAEHAAKILAETRALTHVVTEFLRFAKPMEVDREEVALGTLVERVVAETREAMARVTFLTEGDFTEVPGDEGLLRQALLNLVRNAAEAATGGGPAIESAGESAAPPKVTVRGSVEELGGRRLQRIAIADNGPGVPEEDLQKIFLPFYTTKAEGTGLGLAVVQKIAVQHGGSAEARNLPGGGAEFILWLPAQAAQRQAVDSGSRGI